MIIRIARQFGQCIRARREELGWTQDQLARRADVSRSTVYRLEAGTTTSLYPAKLLAVLDALGLEVSVELRDDVDVALERIDMLDEAGPEQSLPTVARAVAEGTDDRAPFTLDDLLAMGDAYKDYAEQLRHRDDARARDGGEA